MFPQTIFATNPNYLIQGIASFLGDQSIESYNDSIKYLSPESLTSEQLTSVLEKMVKSKDSPIFKDLKLYLSNTKHLLDAFSYIYNDEIAVDTSSPELINPSECLDTQT